MIKIPPTDLTAQPLDLLSVQGASMETLTRGLLEGCTTAQKLGAAHDMSPKKFHKALKAATLADWTQWTRAMVPLCNSKTGISALIADDTVCGHPSGRVLPFAKFLHHGASRRVVYSQNLVALAWTDGTRVIILGLRHWDPFGGVNKHQILREMLDEVIAAVLQADWLLFDGWYLNPDMVYWCAEHRIHCVLSASVLGLVARLWHRRDDAWQLRGRTSSLTSEQALVRSAIAPPGFRVGGGQVGLVREERRSVYLGGPVASVNASLSR